MSFAGHVFAMIQRMKENREMTQKHNRFKDGYKGSTSYRQPFQLPTPTEEDLRRNAKSNQKYKEDLKQTSLRAGLIAFIVTTLVFYWLFF
ncbi:MAG: hypothetical protein AAF990_11675 [Bacteroidota bacterium]